MANEGPDKTTRIWIGIGAVVVAILVFALTRIPVESGAAAPRGSASGGPPSPAGATPPTAEDIALLGGLKTGDDLAGWKVTAITRSSVADMKDTPTVWIQKGEASFIVWIAEKGRSDRPVPVETQKHALYFGVLVGMKGEDTNPPLEALAARIKASESKSPN
jgi:hypothetical protein